MLIAVDTNILLNQALGAPDVIDSINAIRDRVQNVRFVVTPTALEELAWQVDNEAGEKRALALAVFENLLSWGYEPINLIPVGRGIVEQLSLKMRVSGIIDENEVHDSEIIVEAALIGCTLLLTSDHHILETQEHGRLQAFLKECDVDGDSLVAGSPKTIARRFFLKR